MAWNVRKPLAALAVLAVTAALLVGPSQAAPLTGGNTTYVINGEEVTFQFDPLSRKDGLLLPMDVFQKFGIAVEGGTSRNPVLRKGDRKITLSLGAANATVGDETALIAPAPLRLNGRLFASADLLSQFGIEYSQDGAYFTLRDLAEGVELSPSADYVSAHRQNTVGVSLKADIAIYMVGELTLLTPELVASPEFSSNFALRLQMLHLLQTNTLIQIKMRNDDTRAAVVAPAGFFLVDDLRNQYDFTGTVVDIKGRWETKLAPQGEKVAVFVFPKVSRDASTLSVYYEPNQAVVARFAP